MAFTGQAAPYVAGGVAWAWDDTTGDFIPVSGQAGIDLGRSIGDLTRRALVNKILPSGVLMYQSGQGAETNTFTTRVAINGTLVNTFKYAATQTAGTFPAGFLSKVGRQIGIRASGTLGCTATPNLTIDIGLGAGVLATTGALALATATSPAPWVLDVRATVLTAGASGVVVSEGLFSYSTSSSVVTIPWTVGNTVRGTGLSADLTAALAFTLNATCSASSASNRIICDQLVVSGIVL